MTRSIIGLLLLLGACSADARPKVQMQRWDVTLTYQGRTATGSDRDYGKCGETSSNKNARGPERTKLSARGIACLEICEKLNPETRTRAQQQAHTECLRACEATQPSKETCESVMAPDPNTATGPPITGPGLVPR